MQLAVSDYNQIELRILAHLSQDSGLLAAFASHEDVHRTIAASVFGVAPSEVTPEQREQAKAVSYGLAYGMEAFGSVADSACRWAPPRRSWTSTSPASRRCVPTWTRRSKEIRAQGFSRTEFGRIRPFPDIATATGPQRQAAERQAMTRGSRASRPTSSNRRSVRLDRQLRAERLEARLILQVPRRSPRRGAAEGRRSVLRP